MKATWAPELESVWRARFAEMKNTDQPFRAFITKVAESEAFADFALALDEIERQRATIKNLKSLLSVVCDRWKNSDPWFEEDDSQAIVKEVCDALD
jgi:predicted DNA-binding ribbon-helix-helix protein